MKNGERRMENEHGNQKASTSSILSFRQSFPVSITISTFPVPMTSLARSSFPFQRLVFMYTKF